MKISCSTFAFDLSFRNKEVDLFKFIDYCRQIDLDAIELNDGYLTLFGMPLEEIKNKCVLNAMPISAVAIENCFFCNNEEELSQQKEKLLFWLDKTFFLGAPILRVNTGQPGDEARLTNENIPREKIISWTINVFKEIAGMAKEKGIMLVLENHFGITRTPEEVLDIIDRVGEGNFLINIDTGNFFDNIAETREIYNNRQKLAQLNPFTDIYEGIEKLAPKMGYCHAKIWKVIDNNDILLDYGKIFKIFHRHNYRGYISIENFGLDNPLEVIPGMVKMLKYQMSSKGI